MSTLTRLTPAVMIAAALAAVAMTQATEAAVVPAPVVLMPTVHVKAQRAAVLTEVVRLPEVTVVGKRDNAASTQVAQRAAEPRS
ncbi:MAG: hypothetical protein KF788_19460 [Piscinibacter sp.]|nr:hypothetical protein [Piscinibacter sp.]